ncbi:hypothetical protein BJ165DRAFT_1353400 [Panaeolus papilionaceus]|nr:hypothetical protein BJ165DRAFT_1353400 [Panaeolus papilionaceus]
MVATGPDFRTTHRKIKEVMQRPKGILEWAREHNCTFGIEKFQLVDATRRKIPNPLGTGPKIPMERPPLKLREHTIHPTPHAKFLGLIIDQELRWKKQNASVIAKTAEWISKFNRIARQKGGVAYRNIRRLFDAVAMPRILYGIEVFHPPKRSGHRIRFSALERRLESMIGRAAVMVVGGMSTSPRDAAIVHAGMQRITHAIQNANFKAALRLACLPASNPLKKMAQSAAKRYVKRFPTPLHHIMNAFDINAEKMEMIQPRMRLQWDTKRVLCDHPGGREEAIDREKEGGGDERWRAYTDGSALEGKVGGAAILYWGDEEREVRRRYLGRTKRHTVYEAEVIGVELALDTLIQARGKGEIKVGLDNQAVLSAIRH